MSSDRENQGGGGATAPGSWREGLLFVAHNAKPPLSSPLCSLRPHRPANKKAGGRALHGEEARDGGRADHEEADGRVKWWKQTADRFFFFLSLSLLYLWSALATAPRSAQTLLVNAQPPCEYLDQSEAFGAELSGDSFRAGEYISAKLSPLVARWRLRKLPSWSFRSEGGTSCSVSVRGVKRRHARDEMTE